MKVARKHQASGGRGCEKWGLWAAGGCGLGEMGEGIVFSCKRKKRVKRVRETVMPVR